MSIALGGTMALGMMVEGKWTTDWNERDRDGRFNRTPTKFRASVTADGSSGFQAEGGRYHLYVSLACPWAHRTLIGRSLKGLTNAIGVSIVDPVLRVRSFPRHLSRGTSPLI
jgi:putative glutathione S-transferase